MAVLIDSALYRGDCGEVCCGLHPDSCLVVYYMHHRPMSCSCSEHLAVCYCSYPSLPLYFEALDVSFQAVTTVTLYI
jgi:hypothetical protein